MNRQRSSFLAVMGCALLFLGAPAWPAAAEPVAVDTPPGAGPAAQKVPEVEEAVKRFSQRDFEGARGLLTEAVKKHPDLSPARVMMASLFARVNQAPAMRAELETAVVESPDDPEAYQLLADLARQSGHLTEADLCYQKAGELAAKLTSSARRKEVIQKQTALGEALVADARLDWPKAQHYLDQCLSFDPNNAGALLQYGRVLYKQKKPKEALEKLREAVKADPHTLTPEAVLATFYQQDGDNETARKLMVTALTVAPRDLATRLVAADWALGTGQLTTAEQQADAAIQLEPDRIEAINLRGVVALHKKDYAKAVEMFQKMVTLAPTNVAAKNNLALALIEMPDEASRKRALEYAQASAQQFPTQPNILSTWGWVLYKTGRLDEAEAALRGSLERTQGQAILPDTLYYMARVSVDRKRPDEARRFLQYAMQSKTPFSMRPEAEELLKQIGRSPASESTRTTAPVGQPAAKPAAVPGGK